MKKALLVVFALIISVAFVTTVFAQTPATKETKPAEAAPSAKDTGHPGVVKAGPAATAGAAKAQVFKGAVVSVDDAAKTIVVKDKKGEKTFDVSMAKNMPKLKAGDQVSFQYVEKDGKLIAGNFAKKGAKVAPKGASDAVSAGAPVPKEAPAPAPAPAKK